MKILILEDNLERKQYFDKLFRSQTAYHVSSVTEAKDLCEAIVFDVIFLDHDLDQKIWVPSEEENTGYNFVKWLVESPYQKESLNYIHSMNPIGANKMLNLLKDYGRDGIWVPFNMIRSL